MGGNLLHSICIILIISLAWTTVAQFGKQCLSLPPEDFFAPFFLIYLMHLGGSVVYLLYFLGSVCFCQGNADKILKEAVYVYKVEKNEKFFSPTVIKNVLYMTFPMLMLTFTLQYAYAQSLKFITASVAASVMSTNAALVCVLGWVFLKEKVLMVKILGVVFAVVGVIVMSSNEGAQSGTENLDVLGVFLVIFSAIGAAVYNVTFKLIYGHPTVNQVAFFMLIIAVLNVIVNSIPLYVLIQYDYDHIVWEKVPWLSIAAYAGSSVIFQFLVNLGIAILNPLIVSVGVLCALPIISAFDIMVRHEPASWRFYTGVTFFMLAFVFSVFPLDSLWKRKEKRDQPESVALNEESKA
ncbi:unnamed protein product [Bursaphelenchus xylophilus]|uniref:(pine wood nematode) hypothetical protein n=1 Tax=Bursaphelenchus xylophilus TaxID=6326 RepID=A0A1I7S429_BURXY|nr:unnamed protein product [Bursaphelenchus xylophilus]CAG9116662.1 unnamed protein product [Bursaphelenchus xylophilus]